MFRRAVSIVLLFTLLLSVPLGSRADKLNPHHALAYMDITFECGCTRYGTGAMIGKRGLITAGHNLYCSKHGQRLKTCTFLFGAQSTASWKYRYSGKFTYHVYDTFRNGYSSQNDIGYVIFETAVGDSTGWFGYWAAPDKDMNAKFTNLYLYSADARLQTLYTLQYVADSKQIYMDNYLPYSEGGPVFFTGDGTHVVAVYTTYTDPGRGYARRLTNDVINDMKQDGAFN